MKQETNRTCGLFHKIPLFILAVFLFAGCNSAKNEKITVQQVDIESNIENLQEVYLSEYYDDIEYIALDSKEDVILSEYTEYDVGEDYIIAADNNLSMVVFDLSGRFIKRFGQKGRGPEEYQDVNNITIENNRVLFSSYNDLFEFNSEGRFINKYPGLLLFGERYLIDEWSVTEDTLIFGHLPNEDGGADYKAVLMNMEGEILKKYRNYHALESKGSRINPGATTIYSFNGYLHFKEQFSDSLYFLYDDRELKALYAFIMGDLKMPASVRTNFSEYFRKMYDYIAVEDVFETQKYLFLIVNFGNRFPAKRINPKQAGPGSTANNYYNTRYCLGIFNKFTSELVFSKPTNTDNPLFTSGLYNDIDCGPRFFPDMMINDSSMAMLISAKELKDHIRSEDFIGSNPKSRDAKKKLEKLAGELNASDNPVIMVVR